MRMILQKKEAFFKIKVLILFLLLSLFSVMFVCGLYVFFLIKNLPSVQQLKNYQPPLLSTVLDRNGQKAGEFFKERRFLVPYQEFPEVLIQAFVSAEDGRFFEHKGLNVKAIFRAFLANLRAGKKVQGGSTITQQVARALLLSSEKTYKRKLKEAILALRVEKYFTKEEILYLYLNQIYLGHGAYGVGMAGEIYFRKKVKDLNLSEVALLAGLPQAPSRFSPIYNPKKAKERQIYTLNRMLEENYIDQQTAQNTSDKPLKVFLREKHHEKAPYYMETLRQSLLQKIEENQLLTGGLTIKSALDLSLQKAGQESLKTGLRELDKRQGWRGSLTNIPKEENIKLFFEKEEKKLIAKKREFRIIIPLHSNNTITGQENSPSSSESSNKKKELSPPASTTKNFKKEEPIKNNPIEDNKLMATSLTTKEEKELRKLKPNEIVKALVREVSDTNKKVLIELPFNNYGLLPLENMKWARKVDHKVSFKFFSLKKPSLALKKGDVILTKIESNLKKEECINTNNWQYTKTNKQNIDIHCGFLLSLEQEPLVEGALIALDQKTGDILALLGGYSFERSQFNRAYQATRQTGSVFKPLVYLSALDKGWTPATVITDTPVVYEKEEADITIKNKKKATDKEETEEEEPSTWKPDNYGKRFLGDILFRNALIRSMNVPTVKLIEDIGVNWVRSYARRLGIVSDLNPDYTLALGSSSVTLYEMTKMFSIIGRLGKKITPLLLHEVLNKNQETILEQMSLDPRGGTRPEVEGNKSDRRVGGDKSDRRVGGDKSNPLSADQDLSAKEKKTKPDFFFSDPDQLISKQTAFIMTTLLQAVIQDPQGTGGRAREMDWPLAGKTGTTNGYYDAWFIGFSPQIAVGVWVGFDNEKSLGFGETGGRSALPIWLNFMKKAHADMEKEEFEIPEGIIFTHIDNNTGKLVSHQSTNVVPQAFVEGTEPQEEENQNQEETTTEDHQFLREDFS